MKGLENFDQNGRDGDQNRHCDRDLSAKPKLQAKLKLAQIMFGSEFLVNHARLLLGKHFGLLLGHSCGDQAFYKAVGVEGQRAHRPKYNILLESSQ